MFLVRRHTRAEEETGRAELLGATAVGRGRHRWPPRSSRPRCANLLLGVLAPSPGDIASGLAGAGLRRCSGSWTGHRRLVGRGHRAARRAAVDAAPGRVRHHRRRRHRRALPRCARSGTLGSPWLSWLSPVRVGHQAHACLSRACGGGCSSLLAPGAAALPWSRLAAASGAATSAPACCADAARSGAGSTATARRRSGWPGASSAAALIGWTAGHAASIGRPMGSIVHRRRRPARDSDATRDDASRHGRHRRPRQDALSTRTRRSSCVVITCFGYRGLVDPAAARRRARRAYSRCVLATATSRAAGGCWPHGRWSPCWGTWLLLVSGVGLGVGYALATGDGGAIGASLVARLPCRRAGPGAQRRWPGCSTAPPRAGPSPAGSACCSPSW